MLTCPEHVCHGSVEDEVAAPPPPAGDHGEGPVQDPEGHSEGGEQGQEGQLHRHAVRASAGLVAIAALGTHKVPPSSPCGLGELTHWCTVCEERSSTRSALRKHRARSHMCSTCKRRFRSTSGHGHHRKSSHDCTNCENLLRTTSCLLDHREPYHELSNLEIGSKSCPQKYKEVSH